MVDLEEDVYYLLNHRKCYVEQKQLLPLDSVIIENPVKGEQNYGDRFCSLLDDIFGSSESYDTTVVVKKSPSSCDLPSGLSNSRKENVQSSSTGKRYPCTNCPKSFSQQWSMIYHQQVCVGEVTHTCTECNKSYGTAQGLRIHKNIHNVDNCFKCLECEKIFPVKYRLDGHMIRHRGEKPFQCEECGKSYASRGNLNEHKLIHSSERPFSCELCKKAFKFAGNLKLHMRAHNNDRPFKCESCEKRFHNASNLKRHSRIHSALRSLDFKCRHCNQSFLNASTRRNHEICKHDGEKKHVCSYCKKDFFLKTVLTKHMQTHTNERKFKCCEPGCSFTSNWRESVNSHHKFIHLGLRPHSCPTCQKTFKSKSHLKDHQKSHIVQVPVSCPVCQRVFATKALLNRHQVSHNPKTFTCPVCQQSFSTTGHLKLHEVVHTRIKHKIPAVRTICHKELSNKGNLKTHMKNLHPENWCD